MSIIKAFFAVAVVGGHGIRVDNATFSNPETDHSDPTVKKKASPVYYCECSAENGFASSS